MSNEASSVDVAAILEEVGPKIREQLVEAAAGRISTSMHHAIHDEVAKAVRAYVLEHVIPEVNAKLAEQQDALVASILESVAITCEHLRDRLVEETAKNLGQSYKIGAIAREVFGR